MILLRVFVSRSISAARPLEIDFEVKGCEGENNVVRFLEHIQLYVTIRYTQRGALKINITSPHGRFTKFDFPSKPSVFFRYTNNLII